MIEPELLIYALQHPMTGRFYHDPTHTYQYYFAGEKVAECNAELPKEDISEISHQVWRFVLRGQGDS